MPISSWRIEVKSSRSKPTFQTLCNERITRSDQMRLDCHNDIKIMFAAEHWYTSANSRISEYTELFEIDAGVLDLDWDPKSRHT